MHAAKLQCSGHEAVRMRRSDCVLLLSRALQIIPATLLHTFELFSCTACSAACVHAACNVEGLTRLVCYTEKYVLVVGYRG